MTFFSGTDTSTLQKEGSDRNNFVSLIVNNAGTYSAAITRKVEYTEKHFIEMSGKYPFFGTRQVFEIPATTATEEKVRTVIEWFDLTIEKAEIESAIDEYELRFNEVKEKISKQSTSKYVSNYSGNYGGNYGFPSYNGYFGRYWDDDDVVYPYEKAAHAQRIEDLPKAEEKKEEIAVQGDLFKDLEVFDDQLISLSMAAPVLESEFKKLALQIITGCPIISKWVKLYENNTALANEVLKEFNENTSFNSNDYSAFVYDNLNRTFSMIDGEDFFPKYVTDDEAYAVYRLEDVLLIKLLVYFSKLEDNPMKEALIVSIKDFFNIS